MQKESSVVGLVRGRGEEMRLEVAGAKIWVTKADLRHLHDLLSIAAQIVSLDPFTLGE